MSRYDRFAEIDALLRQALETLLENAEGDATLDPAFRLTTSFLEERGDLTMIGSALSEETISGNQIGWDTLPEGGFVFAIAERPIRHRLVFNWLDDVDKRLDEAAR